jgi:tetratricopeptide (TPR) repeat protein
VNQRTLPNLEPLTMMDDRLRQVPRDNAAFRRVIEVGQRELEQARATGDAARLRKALTWVGTARRIAGAHEQAEADLDESLQLARDAGDSSQVIGAMIRLAELYRCRDEFPRAEILLRLTLKVIEKSGQTPYRDFALQHLGKTLIDADRANDAVPLLEEALAIRHQKRSPDLIASTEEALARARG